MDAGGLWGQVLAQLIAVFMPHHHRRELAPEKLEKLGTGLVDGLLRGFVFAAGDGFPPRLQSGGFRLSDDAVDVARPDQAAEGWELVKLVALGGELGGAGLDYFRDFIRCPVIDKPHPL